MGALENWNAQKLDRWTDAYRLGRHDDDCEQRERYGLCHCSKRRRLAAGLTEPPTLSHHAPTCDRCDRDVTFDGDSWVCYPCATRWDSNAGDGDRGEFFDDHGADGLSDADERWGARLIDLIDGQDGAS